jgi:hypothetical protein
MIDYYEMISLVRSTPRQRDFIERWYIHLEKTCVSLWVDYCLVNMLVEWIYAKKCINKAKQLKIKQTQNKTKHKTKQHRSKTKQCKK